MKFKLIPVDSIPEYVNVYCGFDGEHNHLPIIWRNSYRLSNCGWADWKRKYGMVNFYHIYNVLMEYILGIDYFIDEFLRIYYHEFMHLFFKFRLGKWYYSERYCNILATKLYESENEHVGNWAVEIFKDEF